MERNNEMIKMAKKQIKGMRTDLEKICNDILKTISECLSQEMYEYLKKIHDFEILHWNNEDEILDIDDLLFRLSEDLVIMKAFEKYESFTTDTLIEQDDERLKSYGIGKEFLQGLLMMLLFKMKKIDENGDVVFEYPDYIKNIFKGYSDELCLIQGCFLLLIHVP